MPGSRSAGRAARGEGPRARARRRWTAHGQALKDGTTVWWDPSPTTPTPGLRHTQRNGVWGTEVTDVEGIVRWWADTDAVEGGSTTKRMPFVTRDRIVGRA